MQDYIPNSVFVSSEQERLIDSIVSFRNTLIDKNPEIFQDDETYAALNFGSPDTNTKGNPIGLNIEYSDTVPQSIRKELDEFAAKQASDSVTQMASA